MAEENNKPKVTGRRTVKYKQIAEDLARQEKEGQANTRLGRRRQAELLAQQKAEEDFALSQQELDAMAKEVNDSLKELDQEIAKQQQNTKNQQTPSLARPQQQPAANQSALPVAEPRTTQEINKQDKGVQAAAPAQKKEPTKTPSAQKQSEVKTNTAKAVEQLKKVSEEPNKAKTEPKDEKANKASPREQTPQNEPRNESVEEKRNHKGIIFAIAAAVFVLVLFIGGSVFLNRDQKNTSPAPVEEVIEDNTPEPMPAKLKDEWLTNKAINPDFVGCIKFDSGLIDLPFVQATDVYDRYGKPYTFYTEDGQLVEDIENYTGNDVYIWTNWKTGEYDRYEEGGSVFLDNRNNLKDQNLIIYGHHFARDWDPSGSKQFTPLDALLEEGNCEANKSFRLVLDNEVREYVITNVFAIQIDNDYELNIMRRNMNEDFSGNPDPGFFKGFIEYIDKANKYPISEGLKDGDNILTFVTCMQHQPELRQIIIAKEINRTIYG